MSYPRATAVVLALTVVIGLAETIGGAVFGSTVVLKDGLGWGYGTVIYGVGLATFGRSATAEMRGGFVSAAVLALGGVQGLYEFVSGLLRPEAEDGFGELATAAGVSLGGSVLVALVLLRFRRSTDPVVGASWLAARNDALTSAFDAVVVLAGRASEARWPDQVSTAAGVVLSFWAAWTVAREAFAIRAEMRAGGASVPP